MTTTNPSTLMVATDRAISQGAVWHVGGPQSAIDGVHSIPNGRGGRVTSGTNAPFYISDFLLQDDASDDQLMYHRRLAKAFDVDETSRTSGAPSLGGGISQILATRRGPCTPLPHETPEDRVCWQNGQWRSNRPITRKCGDLP